MFRLVRLALLILLLPGPAQAGVIEDATGRRVEVPDHIGRVFPAGPPAAALLYAVAPQALLGWAHEPVAGDCGYIAAPYARLPKLGALTGRAGEVDPETLAQLHPDLVLDVGAVNPRYIDLAKKTQSETELLAWRPDVAVILGADAAAAFASDPRCRDLPAVREKRVLASPTQPFGWVDGPPSPSRLLALRWLGHALYPAEFPDDMRAATRDFYRLFYAVDLTEAMLDELLR